jgi:xanthine dehydrogenase/oxidase
VLTGQCTILRSDLLVDAGQPVNPLIDLGQAQGAFVQGLGYVLTEEVLFDPDGRLLTDGTWEYKPPCSHTIPVDFRVSLRVAERASTRLPIQHTVALLTGDSLAAHRPDVAVLAHEAIQALERGEPVATAHPALAASPTLAEEIVGLPVFDVTALQADPELQQELEDATAAALHSAKVIGEPPLVLAVSAFFALKQAILAAREDAGQAGWFELDAPATVARIREACLVGRDQMRL